MTPLKLGCNTSALIKQWFFVWLELQPRRQNVTSSPRMSSTSMRLYTLRISRRFHIKYTVIHHLVSGFNHLEKIVNHLEKD